MRLVRWLVMGKTCLCWLAAMGPAWPASADGRAAASLGWPEPRCCRLCPASWPGSGPAIPHWHLPAGGAQRRVKGAHNLVLEVRRIELNDAHGVPVGSFR
jgi:hypothetical protein